MLQCIKLFLPYLEAPLEIPRSIRRWRRRAQVDAPFIFLLGPPRSGTTLLHRLILNHSKVVGFSHQTNIFSPQPIHDYRRFAYIDRAIYDRALRDAESMAQFFTAVHRDSFELPEGGWYSEKTPQHAVHLPYLLDRFPQARFVFAMRDPRDGFCSAKASAFMDQLAALKAHARYVGRCTRPLMALSPAQRERVLVVRYEDFTAEPKVRLAEIMAFAGLEAEEAQFAASAIGRDWRSGKAQFERMTQPITPATVGRWRKELPAEQQREYNVRARDILAYFGYEP